MNAALPLFALPYFALDIIFKQVSTTELMLIALCSKHATQVAKHYRLKSKQLLIETVYSGIYTTSGWIKLRNGDSLQTLFCVSPLSELTGEPNVLRLASETIPYTIGEDGEIHTYWQDDCHGITKLLCFTMAVLQRPVNNIFINAITDPTKPRKFFDFVMSCQKSVETCEIQLDNVSDDDLKHILDICKPTGKLLLFATPNRDFHRDFRLEAPKIHLDGSWLCQNHLLSMKSEIIQLHSCVFTDHDLNVFLIAWMNGEIPNLKEMHVILDRDFEPSGAIRGLNATRHAVRQEYSFKKGPPIVFTDCHRLQRNDGVVGTIIYPEDDFRFNFLVWPDFNGTHFDGNDEEEQG